MPSSCSVWVSKSQDIFHNLALEDWIYRNMNFTNHHLLLLWKNLPCVVIGRHQNPWRECNVKTMKACNVRLARRNSGGGTVYHDLGNVNCTFFTSREDYNRKNNLLLICSALKRKWSVDAEVTCRDDILVTSKYKFRYQGQLPS